MSLTDGIVRIVVWLEVSVIAVIGRAGIFGNIKNSRRLLKIALERYQFNLI